MTKLKAYRVTFKTGRYSEDNIIVVAPSTENVEATVRDYYERLSGRSGPTIKTIELLGEAVVAD